MIWDLGFSTPAGVLSFPITPTAPLTSDIWLPASGFWLLKKPCRISGLRGDYLSEMESTDHALLNLYASAGRQDAFSELVRRHVNVVYAAARRQLASEALAEDVTQSVFLDLAKAARGFDPETPVVAWLHVVTRRTAIDLARRESRQKTREQAAMEMLSMNDPSPDWAKIAPLLDEALETLNATDRAALLLRYFENKSLREVGHALGISDDAAQKRVSRALEALRVRFSKKGVAVGVTAFTSSLSAMGAPAAPATLAPVIATKVAALPLVALPAATAAKTAITATAQKSLVAAVAGVAFGGAIAGAYFLFNYEERVRGARQRVEELAAEMIALRVKSDAAKTELEGVEKKIDKSLEEVSPKDEVEAGMIAEMRAWYGRIDRLKKLSQERRDLTIPEFTLLPEKAWFEVSQKAKFDSENHVREAFNLLRTEAENVFVRKAKLAISKYLVEHGGNLPASPQEFASYFAEPIDPAILGRYEFVDSARANSSSSQDLFVLQTAAPVDVEHDRFNRFGPNTWSSGPALSEDLQSALAAYQRAHPGEPLTQPAQLTPYLRWPLSDAAVKRYLINRGAKGKK